MNRFYHDFSIDETSRDVMVSTICHEELEDENSIDADYWVDAISTPVTSPLEEDIKGIL